MPLHRGEERADGRRTLAVNPSCGRPGRRAELLAEDLDRLLPNCGASRTR